MGGILAIIQMRGLHGTESRAGLLFIQHSFKSNFPNARYAIYGFVFEPGVRRWVPSVSIER
jgi:hypothetical protein